MLTKIKSLLHSEASVGIFLMISTVAALILANSPWASWHQAFIDYPLHVSIGNLHLHKPLLLWINDGLMAIFFFLVGLELKREKLEGELADPSQIILPAAGALGGMLIPALIYTGFNFSDPELLKGWAIPAATDIAFALGILSLLGSRVPVALKVFLTSVAIFDDLGAILIIAFFYTSELSFGALGISLLTLPFLFLLNRKGVTAKMPYIILGIIMWTAMLKSGVHATLAGVLTAFFIPLKPKEGEKSMLRTVEHDLHSWVSFFVLPVFAFANSGVPLLGIESSQIFHSVPVGIALGLLLGKPIGVMGFSALLVLAGKAKLPKGMSFKSLFGVAALCGIGFTMSFFVGSLAFTKTPEMVFDERIGILGGSLLSGIIGYFILNKSLSKETLS